MHVRTAGWVLACLLLVTIGCQSQPGPEVIGGLAVLPDEPPAEAVESARAATGELATRLQGELFRALESGDPSAAIGICGTVAYQIAEEQSRDGLTIRRVSERFRNPKSEPDAFELEMLARLEAMRQSGELPEELTQVVSHGDQRELRYLKPIVVMPPCLNCHGQPTDLDESVLTTLGTMYPEDKAVGYSTGDLRGAFSVRVQL